MTTRLIPLTDDHLFAVKAFNQRLKAGGVGMKYPESVLPTWLPPSENALPFQEHFVALDDDGSVRGGYILKHQSFKIGDEFVEIADLRLPISEGIVDRTFANLGVELLFDSLRKQPLLFGMGIGGEGEAIARLFKAGGWKLTPIPFFFKIVSPYRFLRGIRFLRNSTPQRLMLDALAFSGLGTIAAHSCQKLSAGLSHYPPAASVKSVDQFGDWANTLWQSCNSQYGVIAIRDASVLNRLYNPSEEKFIRLRVSLPSGTIGWCVVLDTQMSGHRQFGDLRVGSIVDALASPKVAETVVHVAANFLARRGVDLIVSNQSHHEWCTALRRSGFLKGPSNYLFATSKRLTKLIERAGHAPNQYYLNRGDGDGPINL